jgi:CheY-like chemotaxis protein
VGDVVEEPEATEARASHVVLVVEDDADIRASIADVLEHKGYMAVGAANGLEALDCLQRAERLPCLILLDLMMPIMDGNAFRAKQLENPAWSTIPVLLMSAYRDIAEQAKSLGVEYLPKPLGVRRLMEGIERFCSTSCGAAGSCSRDLAGGGAAESSAQEGAK